MQKVADEAISMDCIEVQEYLPHRYPFLMIDRVLELVPGKSIIAIKNVTMNEPCFMGHFPGNPVMPGVMIIEALAQAAGILAYKTDCDTPKESLHFLGSIKNAKFKQIVRPGDQLELHIEVASMRTNFCKVQAKAIVDGKVVCQAEIMSAKQGISSDS